MPLCLIRRSNNSLTKVGSGCECRSVRAIRYFELIELLFDVPIQVVLKNPNQMPCAEYYPKKESF